MAAVDWCRDAAQVTIDMIPDVALLRIFDFCLDEPWYEQEWHLLVHVCQKWRSIVFGSPLRLKLRLYCKARTPVRETLDVWPPFPIVIEASGLEQWRNDNINVALEHNDRVCQVDLFLIPRSQLEKVLAAMQQQFPALTNLRLGFEDGIEPVHPDSFLGGSAPRLQSLTLYRIPFPGLPKLLLSTTHLVDLHLMDIPHSGYISPEAMVTCLSMLTRLESLMIGFKSPLSRPASDRRNQRPPPQTRTLPVLNGLWFEGVNEYVEDLISRIDAPLFDNLTIHYFPQLILATPRLTQFICRTPKLKTYRLARLKFCEIGVWVKLQQPLEEMMELKISFRRSDWQLSSLTQVLSSSLPRSLGGTARDFSNCIFAILARRHREQPMARRFTSIRVCEVSPHIARICAAYHAHAASTRQGRSNRSLARPADTFLREATPNRSCPGSHSFSRTPQWHATLATGLGMQEALADSLVDSHAPQRTALSPATVLSPQDWHHLGLGRFPLGSAAADRHSDSRGLRTVQISVGRR